jgi:hypothetical protein
MYEFNRSLQEVIDPRKFAFALILEAELTANSITSQFQYINPQTIGNCTYRVRRSLSECTSRSRSV